MWDLENRLSAVQDSRGWKQFWEIRKGFERARTVKKFTEILIKLKEKKNLIKM